MEVKPGYKQTVARIIPEDWGVQYLGGVAAITTGRKDVNEGNPAGEYPFFTCSRTHTFSDHYSFDTEAILIAGNGEVGNLHYYSGRFEAYQRTYVVHKFSHPAHYIWHQLDYRLAASLGLGKIGTSIPYIKKEDLTGFAFPVPPSDSEQRAIATALNDADALLGALDRLITKKRDLKQAAMQQLLTGQTRLPGFGSQTSSLNHSVFGQFPSDWEMLPLAHVSAFITKGSTPTTYGFQWANSGVLFLRSECVSEQGLDLSESMFIAPEAHRFLRRSEVKAGDILMTITGNVGRVVHLGSEFRPSNINQHIARIRITDDRVVASFIFQFLSQSLVRKYYNQITTGQAYPQISLTQVRDTILPMPPTAEQAAIGEVLSEMDAELRALEQRREKTRALKQAMMQELLTGKTRLV
jgi:type I restriction enzyme S subunit